MDKVGCAGILVADTFCGPMSALPRAGQLLAVDAMPSRAGGCAANVAIDLARQNVAVDVSGCLGQDSSSAVIVKELEAAGVGCAHLVYTPDQPTSKTVILLVEGDDRRYIHMFGANAAFTVGHIRREWVAGLRVFYLGGLFLMPSFQTQELRPLLQFCRDRGVITVVDVVIPQQATDCRRALTPLLPYIDYFMPNNDEAQVLTGCARATEQAGALLAAGAGTVIITQGQQGMLAAQGKEAWQTEAYAMDVVDPSGAGDAAAAGVITGICNGWDLPATLRYAGALGASAVRAVGTTAGVFNPAEATAFIAAHALSMTKVPL